MDWLVVDLVVVPGNSDYTCLYSDCFDFVPTLKVQLLLFDYEMSTCTCNSQNTLNILLVS